MTAAGLSTSQGLISQLFEPARGYGLAKLRSKNLFVEADY